MNLKTLFSALLFILFIAVAHSEAKAQYGGYYRPRRAYVCPPPPPVGYCAPVPAYCAAPAPVYYGRRHYRPRYYGNAYRPHYRHYGYRRCR